MLGTVGVRFRQQRGASCASRLRDALLQPPRLEQRLAALRVAFAAGAQTVSVIPTRAGNGLMDEWQAAGWFAPPQLHDLHEVQRQGFAMGHGRVFVDLWNAAQFAACARCAPRQIAVIEAMNFTQQAAEWPVCPCDGVTHA